MKFTKKVATSFANKVTESFFKIFTDVNNQGENFTWRIFRYELLPKFIKTQMFLSFGDNKNWKSHLPKVLEQADNKCIQLFIEYEIIE